MGYSKKKFRILRLCISKEGVKPSTTKIAALKHAKRPEDAKAIQSFLGITNYVK